MAELSSGCAILEKKAPSFGHLTSMLDDGILVNFEEHQDLSNDFCGGHELLSSLSHPAIIFFHSLKWMANIIKSRAEDEGNKKLYATHYYHCRQRLSSSIEQ